MTPSGERKSGPCPAKFYCVFGAVVPTPCPPGTYCSGGNAVPSACGAGTHNVQEAQAQCYPCPAGFFCSMGTIDYAVGSFYLNVVNISVLSRPFTCPAGHFCSEAMISLDNGSCPIGTFSNTTGNENVSQCRPCLAGMYCGAAGLAAPTGSCSGGYYCSGGSGAADASVCDSRGWVCDSPSCEYMVARKPSSSCGGLCPVGSYCPGGSGSPTPCPAGLYCGTAGLQSPSGPCLAGYYCSGLNNSSPRAAVCPAGFYCPAGTVWPVKCGRGTYLDTMGNTNGSACKPCVAGYYCPYENMTNGTIFLCVAGYFCPPACSYGELPSNICPFGMKCPPGSALPVACPNGTYQDQLQGLDCKFCLAGFFCPGSNSANLSQPSSIFICPSGYFCPGNSSFPLRCPTGTYSNATGLSGSAECALCPAGRSCAGTGLITPGEDCAAGYFCESGATGPYVVLDLVIPSGRQKAGPCPAGFFCTAGTVVPSPCPAGTYCGGGNSAPEPCQAGTYNMQEAQAQCNRCPAGFFCSPGGVVDYGQGTYYGTAGQYECADPDGGLLKWSMRIGTNSTDLAGRVGADSYGGLFVTMSSQGGVSGAANAGGYDAYMLKYNESGYMLWTYVLGSSGNDMAQGLAVDSTGSAYMGVRSNSTGLVVKLDGCGKELWRVVVGTLAVGSAFELAAGPGVVYVLWKGGNGTFVSQYGWNGTLMWVLNLGLDSSDVAASVSAGADGSGYVAGQASRSVGGQPYSGGGGWDLFVIRFNSSGLKVWTRMFGTGQDESARGSAVDSAGNLFVVGTLNASNASVSFWGGICAGTTVVTSTFSSTRAITTSVFSSVQPVTSTKAATSSSSIASTASASMSRLKTTSSYASSTSASFSAAATTSPGVTGASCNTLVGTWTSTMWGSGSSGGQSRVWGGGLSALIVKVAADGSSMWGWSEGIVGGTVWAIGVDVDENGSAYTVGYFNSSEQAQNASGSGMFVNKYNWNGSRLWRRTLNGTLGGTQTGGIAVGGPIGGSRGVVAVGNLNESSGGGPAPASVLLARYSTAAECSGLSEGGNFVCPAGLFCMEGMNSSDAGLCPVGTFSNTTGLGNISQCRPCLAGMYCGAAGLAAPTGSCSGGYYCSGGSGAADASVCDSRGWVCDSPSCEYMVARKPSSSCGGLCPVGSYCPGGSGSPTPCPAGLYCGTAGLQSPSGPCLAGYYCSGLNNSSPRAAVCPAGFYCPAGTVWPVKCGRGTYLDTMGNTNGSACKPCVAGYYCPYENMTSGALFACNTGYYCPTGSSEPSILCAAGFDCPVGSGDQHPCGAGYFQRSPYSDHCDACIAGYYCPGTAFAVLMNSSVICPRGQYCPMGSDWPIPCPAGSFSALEGSSSCSDCPAGFACETTGTSYPDVCPLGHYCPINTSEPSACPP